MVGSGITYNGGIGNDAPLTLAPMRLSTDNYSATLMCGLGGGPLPDMDEAQGIDDTNDTPGFWPCSRYWHTLRACKNWLSGNMKPLCA